SSIVPQAFGKQVWSMFWGPLRLNGRRRSDLPPTGARLREIRKKLRLTTRDVETLSRKIADAEKNEEFICDDTWITRIETEEKLPNIFVLFSLSVIYRIKFTDLLSLYGVNLARIAKHQLEGRLDNTSLADLTVYDGDQPVTFPVRF